MNLDVAIMACFEPRSLQRGAHISKKEPKSATILLELERFISWNTLCGARQVNRFSHIACFGISCVVTEIMYHQTAPSLGLGTGLERDPSYSTGEQTHC